MTALSNARRVMALLTVVGTSFGCASSGTFEQTLREADNTKQLHREREASTILNSTIRKQQARIDELEARLHAAQEQLARTEREWREARDELVSLKVEREQQSRQGPHRGPGEPTRLAEPERIPELPRSSPSRAQMQRGANEHLRELQRLLDQF